MSFLRSLKFAFRGIIHCIKNERNMRIHTVATIYILLFVPFFNLSLEKLAILLLTISAVLAAEMVNTATEELSDLSAEDYNPMARIAKDVAAGAVLIISIFAVFIGFLLLWDLESFKMIYRYFKLHSIRLFLLLISFFIAYIYIHFGPSDIKNRIWKIIFLRKQKNKWILKESYE